MYKKIMALLSLLFILASFGLYAEEVLVSVGKYQVTADELETAILSSPVSVQFNTMDEKEQAAIRGDILKRLVSAKLLRLEAESQGLNQSPAYQQDVKNFKTALYYRLYMDKLRAGITPSKADLQHIKEETKGNQDEYLAAKSAYKVSLYQKARTEKIQQLAKRYHVRFFTDRIQPDIADNTLLMQADEGIKVIYADIKTDKDWDKTRKKFNHKLVEENLYKQAELLLIAKTAQTENIDISRQLESFKIEQLTSELVDKLKKEWVSDEKKIRAYFLAHREIAMIPERRNIGMIVLKTRKEAEQMQKRIQAGESLFELAGKYSIDPWGKAHNGDYGWIKQGSIGKKIDAVLDKLADNQLSEIVETSRGYHLMMIIGRRPGATRSYAGIKDKIKQMMIDEKMTQYLQQLQQKYKVVWHLLKTPDEIPAISEKQQQENAG